MSGSVACVFPGFGRGRGIAVFVVKLLLALGVLAAAGQVALTAQGQAPPRVIWSAEMLVGGVAESVGGFGPEAFSNQSGGAGLEAQQLWSYVPNQTLQLAFTAPVPGQGPMTLQIGELLLEFQAGQHRYTWRNVRVDWVPGETIQARIFEGGNQRATGRPALRGTAQAGRTLTADTSGIQDRDGIDADSWSYEWYTDEQTALTLIEDAEDETYEVSDADVGKRIRVRVSFKDEIGFSEMILSAASAVVTRRPNTAAAGLPTITGTARAGETLTADVSGITDADGIVGVDFDYQWLSLDGRVESEIADATASSLRLTNEQAGRTIKVRVTFDDNRENAESLTSLATAEVESFDTEPTGAPSIQGVLEVGAQLTVDTVGIADADGLSAPGYEYQWISGGTEIAGQTGSSYTLTAADVGRSIQVRATFTDDLKTTAGLTSAATDAVAAEHATRRLLWLGTLEVASLGGLQGYGYSEALGGSLAPNVFSYESDTLVITGIGHGSNPGYRDPYFYVNFDAFPASDRYELWSIVVDGTSQLRVDVDSAYVGPVNLNDPDSDISATWFGPEFSLGWTSGEQFAVSLYEAINLAATGVPTISGDAVVESTLTVDTSEIDDPNGVVGVAFDYEWLADGVEIANATESSYVVAKSNLGKTISVRVSFDDGDGFDESATSVATAAVKDVANATGAPSIQGILQVGEELSADIVGIADPDGIDETTISYQWISGGSDIANANASTYTLTAAEVGDGIQVRVTFEDENETVESLISAETPVVVETDAIRRLLWLGTVTVANLVDEPQGASFGFDGRGGADRGGVSPGIFAEDGTTYSFSELSAYIARNTDNATLSFDLSPDLTEEKLDGWMLALHGVEVDLGSMLPGQYSNGERYWSMGISSTSINDRNLWRAGDRFVASLHEAVNIPANGVLTVEGAAQVGETLTVAEIDISDANGLLEGSVPTYQWISGVVEVDGAIFDSYELSSADLGKAIQVRVSFKDKDGFAESVTSAPTEPVAAARENVPATGAPSIRGVLEVGEELTAETVGIADADGLSASGYEYQWIAGGTDIAGQSASKYTLTAEDAGKSIQVRVSFSDDAKNSESLTSASTDAVVASHATRRLIWLGTLSVQSYELDGWFNAGFFSPFAGAVNGDAGHALFAAAGSTYEIYAIQFDIASGTAVLALGIKPTPTHDEIATWRLSMLDTEFALADSVQQIGVDSTTAFTWDVTALPINDQALWETGDAFVVSLLQAFNQPATGAPTIAGTALVEETLTAGTGAIDDPNGIVGADFEYQWLADGVEIANATESTYVVGEDDVGKALSVRVSFTDDDGFAEVATSVPTAAVAARETIVWTATLTVGSRDGERGYTLFGQPSIGALSPVAFALDGSSATVYYALLADGELHLGLNRRLGREFRLRVGAHELVSSEATVGYNHNRQYPIYRFSWSDPGLSWSAADELELSLALEAALAAANSPAAGRPLIVGEARVDETLSVDPSSIADADGLEGVEFSYQWLRDGVRLRATGSSYTVRDADLGGLLTVEVSFLDQALFSETVISEPTAAVENRSGPLRGFTLVDASNQRDLATLSEGLGVTLADPTGGRYGLRVFTATDARIGSVRLELTGAKTVVQTENFAPYSLYGDTGGRLNGSDLPVGSYTLTATAYAGRRLSGAVLDTLQLSFTVEAVLVPVALGDGALREGQLTPSSD